MSEWTNKRPDTAGVYWLRLPSGNDKGTFLVAIEKLISPLGNITMKCIQSCPGGQLAIGWYFTPYDPPDDMDDLEKDALWSGPLKPPETER